MKAYVSLNPEFLDYLQSREGAPNYNSSFAILNGLVERGFETYVVFPGEILNGVVQNVYKLCGRELRSVRSNETLSGDLFFARSFGEDSNSSDVPFNFLDELSLIERNFQLMVNGASSSRYKIKKEQKKLDLPFIHSYDIPDISSLEKILDDGVQLIAKPNVGFMSRGILFFGSSKDIGALPSGFDPEDYCFERFVEEPIERRYVFLDGSFLIGRVWEKEGSPGKENKKQAYINHNPDVWELEIVKRAIESTGMFYGCVDFRGGRILEINGSGTGTTAVDRDLNPLYDITDEVLDAIQRKIT